MSLFPALQAMKSELLPTELLFAFLDEIYVLCRPERVTAVHQIVASHLESHCGIRCHLGKTKVYNKAGVTPPGMEELQRQAEEQGSTERIWVGDQTLPTEQQGVVLLGSPIGTLAFAESQRNFKNL